MWGLCLPNFRPLASLVWEESEMNAWRHARSIYKISKLPLCFASFGRDQNLWKAGWINKYCNSTFEANFHHYLRSHPFFCQNQGVAPRVTRVGAKAPNRLFLEVCSAFFGLNRTNWRFLRSVALFWGALFSHLCFFGKTLAVFVPAHLVATMVSGWES